MSTVKTVHLVTPESQLTQLVCQMFAEIGISVAQSAGGSYDLTSLDGKLLDRNPFLGVSVAKQLDPYIPRLKGYLKSSALTSLHSNSKDKQQNPALNLFRQTLRCLDKKLTPVVISNGYCKHTGKKLYRRYYRVEPK